MTRPLMHPLRQGGSLTRVEPGHWESIQRPEQVTDIDLTEHVDRGKRPGISSIPSPWARLQLFRDAVLDAEHPAHEDVVNDILDALELVLFQRSLSGVRLDARTIDLDELQRNARAQRKVGVERFVDSLRELAPDVGHNGQPLGSLTLVFNNDRLLFATSPFTLVFAPEDIRADLPGYFIRKRPIRPLSERPPLLAQYVRDRLIPDLGRADVGALPELQRLSRLLEEQLEHVTDEDESGARFVDARIYPADGISLQVAEGGVQKSPLMLTAKRKPQAPLVLDNSNSPLQRRYFPWLERPTSADVAPALPRTVLPGTSWKYDWISPEHDFLVEKLIILDSPVYGDRVYGPGSQANETVARVLLPLTKRFFEYFSAKDVADMLTIRVEGAAHDPRVHVTLSVPVSGGKVTVEKEYHGSARLAAAVSVWPGFITAEPPDWHDYYVVAFVEGEDVGEALDVAVGAGGRTIATQQFQRDLSTVVHHFEQPPECVFIRERTKTVGDSRVAEGVILPQLRIAPPATKPAWKIAIDFGTSNTVIAYADGGQKRTLDLTQATRFDLTRAPDEAGHIGAVLDTFFFPPSLESGPFGTVVFRSLSADVASPAAQIPAVTANVPFSGDVNAGLAAPGARNANEVIGDLKWGGGGTDSERLTKLFLHQALQLVHAEARARGVQTANMDVRWSYPSAFSPRKHGTTETRWQALVSEFEQARLRTGSSTSRSASPSRSIESRDESTAAMLYLRNDPAGRGSFGPHAPYLKVTADVGGGTTDVAAYANGGIVFRSSVLLGGRDLVSEPSAGMTLPGIFARVYAWAQSNQLPLQMRRVIDAYPSHHAKFTYLVRHKWFLERRGVLSAEPWFPAVQACILYFYGAIHYNIGLQLRGAVSDEVRPPDLIFFGGNGSGYLNWLTEFTPWNSARSRDAFSGLFQKILEAGFEQPLGGELEVRTSSQPKHEVALGLLEEAIPMSDRHAEPPLGEAITLKGESAAQSHPAESSLPSADLAERGVSALRWTKPFSEWEITRFNTVFHEQLALLASTVDPQWRLIARRAQGALDSLDERFYDNQVKNALQAHLNREDVGTVTLFVLEAAVTLRRLEQSLVGE